MTTGRSLLFASLINLVLRVGNELFFNHEMEVIFFEKISIKSKLFIKILSLFILLLFDKKIISSCIVGIKRLILSSSNFFF